MKNENKQILGVGDLVDMLAIVNIKISMLESAIRNPDKSNEEAGKMAREIRQLNNKRIALRNALNRMTNSGFEEMRIEHFEI